MSPLQAVVILAQAQTRHHLEVPFQTSWFGVLIPLMAGSGACATAPQPVTESKLAHCRQQRGVPGKVGDVRRTAEGGRAGRLGVHRRLAHERSGGFEARQPGGRQVKMSHYRDPV